MKIGVDYIGTKQEVVLNGKQKTAHTKKDTYHLYLFIYSGGYIIRGKTMRKTVKQNIYPPPLFFKH